MTPVTPAPAPTLDRWVSYDSNGFVAMPWRLGSVCAPMVKNDAIASTTGSQRDYESLERVIALEVVGSRGVVYALARMLRKGEPVTFASSAPRQHSRQVWWASGGLQIFEKKLPSGPTHALFLHPQAVAGDLNPHKPAYAIAREEDPMHVYRILNVAIPVPLLPAWVPWLIEAAERWELLFRLKSENLWGIEISPDIHGWAALVQKGLTSGKLQWDS